MNSEFKPTIHISACLLGQRVRYDGGHKEDRYPSRTLSDYVIWLPVEEEGHLKDPVFLEIYMERIFACHRLKQLLDSQPKAGDLVGFHTTHKQTLMAHRPVNDHRPGKLVVEAGRPPLANLLPQYADLFRKTLRMKATPQKHARVLYHIPGYFKKDLEE